ncbi:hypothetical protein [Endozoicomonas sp. 8E]|uniref:hypothetical protein n=1 Tax=Endozoicomonas sp. 8E TaxID=3035692 RepID=UPI0029394EF3|nr:hypothetical protein [Endozoicomonas sp. 8E]WOG30473.1 hypothetical protein P6910_12965 [Endozoicomonas sp. 8E]
MSGVWQLAGSLKKRMKHHKKAECARIKQVLARVFSQEIVQEMFMRLPCLWVLLTDSYDGICAMKTINPLFKVLFMVAFLLLPYSAGAWELIPAHRISGQFIDDVQALYSKTDQYLKSFFRSLVYNQGSVPFLLPAINNWQQAFVFTSDISDELRDEEDYSVAEINFRTTTFGTTLAFMNMGKKELVVLCPGGTSSGQGQPRQSGDPGASGVGSGVYQFACDRTGNRGTSFISGAGAGGDGEDPGKSTDKKKEPDDFLSAKKTKLKPDPIIFYGITKTKAKDLGFWFPGWSDQPEELVLPTEWVKMSSYFEIDLDELKELYLKKCEEKKVLRLGSVSAIDPNNPKDFFMRKLLWVGSRRMMNLCLENSTEKYGTLQSNGNYYYLVPDTTQTRSSN